MGRSFEAFISRINKDGANIKIDVSFEGRGREIPRKDKQKIRRCRLRQKSIWQRSEQTQRKRGGIHIAEIEAAKEQAKIEAVKEQTKIEPAKEQAKIEAEKELVLKELELKAQQDQASTSLAAVAPPRNKDAKSWKLPSFIDEKDELDSYLLRCECYAENASWEKKHS